MHFIGSNNISLKYQRFTPSGHKDIGIRKLEFVTKTQFLWLKCCFKKIIKYGIKPGWHKQGVYLSVWSREGGGHRYPGSWYFTTGQKNYTTYDKKVKNILAHQKSNQIVCLFVKICCYSHMKFNFIVILPWQTWD